MGKNELPHPKHRPAGTPTRPSRANEELRDDPRVTPGPGRFAPDSPENGGEPNPFDEQLPVANTIEENTSGEPVNDAELPTSADVQGILRGREMHEDLELEDKGTPIAGDVLGSGANEEQPSGAPELDENQGSRE